MTSLERAGGELTVQAGMIFISEVHMVFENELAISISIGNIKMKIRNCESISVTVRYENLSFITNIHM